MYFKKNINSKKYHLNTFWFCFLSMLFLFSIDVSIAQNAFDNEFQTEQRILLGYGIGGGADVHIDQEGNFIVTDMEQNKVNCYTSGGDLLFSFGKEGRGPGDFSYPTSTIRLNSDELLTTEFAGKISLFTATGDSLIKTYTVELLPLSGVHEIDDTRVLLVGRNRAATQQKLLHIFDLSEGRIIKSFFNAPFSLPDNEYGGIFTSFANLVSVDINDGKIAAVVVPFPEIMIFTDTGTHVNSLELDFKYFTKIKKFNGGQVSRRQYNNYMTTFSMMNGIYMTSNNEFYISYYRLAEFEAQRVAEIIYSFAKVGSDGGVLFEMDDTPNLRAAHNDDLYFDNLNHDIVADLLKGRFVQ